MQFNFTDYSTYTSPLTNPLSFNFSPVRTNYTADLYTFGFGVVSNADSIFTVSIVPATISTSTFQTNPLTANLSLFDIDRAYSDLSLDIPSHVANNANVQAFELYKAPPSSCRVSADDWRWDFSNQVIQAASFDWTVFNIIPDTCAQYTPTNEFNLSVSCYGEPCIVEQDIFNGFIGDTMDNVIGSFDGDVILSYIGDVVGSTGDLIGSVQAYTTDQYIADVTDTLVNIIGSVDAFTPESHDGDITGSLADLSGSVLGYTTELYEGSISGQMENVEGTINVITSEQHEAVITGAMGQLVATIDASIPDNNVGAITGVMDSLIGLVDTTYNQPTFVQYLSKDICVASEQAEPVSAKYLASAHSSELFNEAVDSVQEDATGFTLLTCAELSNIPVFTKDFCTTAEDAAPINLLTCAPLENAGAISAKTCVDQTTAEYCTIDVCHGSVPLAVLTNTTCAISTRTDINFLATDRVIDQFVNPYTPVNIFELVTATPHKVFIVQSGNTYIDKAVYHSEYLTGTTCAPAEGSKFFNKHICETMQETEVLPIGVTVVVDPPREPVDPTPPDTGVTITIPNKEFYDVINTITVQLVSGAYISFDTMNLSLDSDSHSWSFSGTLSNPDDRAAILPSANGGYTEAVITVNGYTWSVLIEGVKTTRTFNNKSVVVTGRGVTALLSAPYQKTYSLVQTELQTNQQVAESLLPFGWTLTWALDIWNLPTGTYTHTDMNSAKALAAFVSECGGMLVPDRASQTFHAKKRYPVLPWNFGATTANFIIPESAILQLTEEPVGQYGVDGVYVHGTTTDGVQALARLTGTAGSRLASTVSSRYVTDSTAVRAIGERVLAGEYAQPVIKNITTFMDGVDVPLMEIGSLIEISADGSSTKGIINNISVNVSLENNAPVVAQSISIGESTNNTLSLLREVIPAKPMLLGKILSTSGTSSKVLLVDGGNIEVRGSGTIGANYYIIDDIIQSVAPTVTALSEVVI